MNSVIYKRKSPLLVFLIPAFLFLAVYAWRLLQQDPVVRPEFSEGLLSRLLFD